jgi:SAM-dependent methyltransferase
MSFEERFKGANVFDAGRLSPYWGEHAARYHFALPFVAGKRVLDIACGTGYGLALLAETAGMVVGVDVDAEAALAAKKECGRNTQVLLGDGTGLPFPDESFDVVTSFETLEHLHNRKGFLSELRRVLKFDGKLILSTPNANYTQPVNGKPTNLFHVFEYNPDELRPELQDFFHLEKFLGQTLDKRFPIPPFQEMQNRLPHDWATQARLFCWRVMNKFPFAVREKLSDMLWSQPFYPTEKDYNFAENTVAFAPVLVAVGKK